MTNVWESVQRIASVTRHVEELQDDMADVRREIREARDELRVRIRALEVDVAALKEARETTKETIRAEIALAVADLRVRFAEEQLRRERRALEPGQGEESQ